jgi:hypothetical protein
MLKKILDNFFIFLITLVFFAAFKMHSASLSNFFTVDIKSDRTGTGQLFYDIGRGFNEKDSVRFEIKANELNHCIVRLPNKKIYSLRIDPLDKKAVIEFKNPHIESHDREILINIPFESFKAFSQIDEIGDYHKNELFYFKTTGQDPYFVIENIKISKKYLNLNFFKHELLFYILFASILYFIKKFVYEKTIFLFLGRQILNSKPLISITLIALFSTLLSCYPLLFGKSLNYAAGLPMLYETVGWFPGYQFEGIYESFRGSDVAAHSWDWAPKSKLVYQSIFNDNEFPFWNRYAGAGLPLWGQGCYMVGDPLHWITIIFKGSAIAWDIKFFLSKFIFTLGIGFLAYQITRKIMLSTLMALIAPFIGHYTFAFNHPTYFCLTYIPWLIIQWIRFSDIIKSNAIPGYIKLLAEIFLLVMASWLSINSGNTKESSILFGLILVWGIVITFCSFKTKPPLFWRILILVYLIITILLCLSPYILIFLTSLHHAATSYDLLSNNPYRTSFFLAFFDPLIFQKANHGFVGPSVNLAILFLFISSLNKKNFSNLLYLISFISFLISYCFAFGLIPDILIFVLPLIGRVQHTGITFAIPMIIFSFIIAIFGAKTFERKKIIVYICRFLYFLLSSILIIYFLSYQPNERYANLIYLFFLAASILIYILKLESFFIKHTKNRKMQISSLFFSFLLFFVLKNGLHFFTGIRSFDSYTINPNVRLNTEANSKSINFIKGSLETYKSPYRVIGSDLVLIPGVNYHFQLETIGSAEALKNPYLEKFFTVNHIEPEPGWGWFRKYTYGKPDNYIEKIYDMLGVRYVLATPGKLQENKSRVFSADLDVYERPNVWPRAFFISQYLPIKKDDDLPEIIKKEDGIFVAILTNDANKNHLKNNNFKDIIPAAHYVMTSNKTCFAVEASSAGIVVLGEGYYPDDFQLKVNGIPTKYFRVNLWQKAFIVKKPGNYNACYEYIPSSLIMSLYLCAIGFCLLVMLPLFYIKLMRKL